MAQAVDPYPLERLARYEVHLERPRPDPFRKTKIVLGGKRLSHAGREPVTGPRARWGGMTVTPKITMTHTPEAHIKEAIVGPLTRFNEA